MRFIIKLTKKNCVYIILIFLCFFTIYSFVKRLNETYFDYKSRSTFYQLMRKKDKFDFIKTAEKELDNINIYIYQTQKDILFCYFLTEEKIKLIEEIEKTKLEIYSKNGKVKSKDKPHEYRIFAKLYPELISKFKDYGKIIEYEKIDYYTIYNNKKDKEKRKYSDKNLIYYDKAQMEQARNLTCYKILGLENFGLTINAKKINRINTEKNQKIKKDELSRIQNIRRQLYIKNGIQDLFYENNKVGSISINRKENGKDIICSFHFNSLLSEELNNCKFELKNNSHSFPYYFCSVNEWVYLIYPGISGSFYPGVLFDEDNSSIYLKSLDLLHQNQKKYVLVQCKKDFYKNFEDFSWFNDDTIINKIMIFYQDE